MDAHYSPYFLRWVNQVEVFLCVEEIEMLKMSMDYAFQQLYSEDKENDSPSFDILHRGYLLLQLKNQIFNFPNQKRFQSRSNVHMHKVNFPLALLSCMYDVIVYSKIPELIRLKGNVETVLASYGYQFEDQEPVSELDADIEDHYRLESEINEFKQKYLN